MKANKPVLAAVAVALALSSSTLQTTAQSAPSVCTGPALSLYDDKGRERAAIQTEELETSLRLSNADGKGVVDLGMRPSGLPSLLLFYT